MATDLQAHDTAPKVTRFILPGIMAMIIAFLIAVLVTGITAPTVLSDPGAFVRWGLPIARAIHHTSMAVTVSALIFAAAIVPRVKKLSRDKNKNRQAPDHPAFTRSLNIAAGAGVIWTLAAAAVMILTFWDLAGTPMNLRPEFSAAILDYITGIVTGRAWAWMVIIAAITTSLALAVRSKTGVA